MSMFERCRSSRWCRRLFGFLVALAMANIFVADIASADVGSQMNSFFNGLGGSANVTGPVAYQGQAGVYYTGGSIWVRTKDEQLSLGSLQLPSAKAGCGGIDLFTGGFSFINSDQLVAAGKAVANGALMFVFQMALKAISSLIDSTLTDQLQKLQQMISQSKSACQTGMNIAAGLAGQVGARNTQFCSMVGNSQGFFSDWAASEQGCGTGGQQASTLNRNTDSSIPTKSVNYTWKMLKDGFGSWDDDWRQYMMTILGTVVYVKPENDSTNGTFQFRGNADESTLTALLDGGSFKILKCDETTDCLDPELSTVTLDPAKGLKHLVSAQLTDMVTKIQSEQALTTQEIAILGSTSIPVYKILAIASLSQYGGGLMAGDIDSLSEAVAVDMLHTFLRKEITVAAGASSSFQNADLTTLQQWRDQMGKVEQRIASLQIVTANQVQRTESIISRTRDVEKNLRNGLSPSMSAALALDRSLAPTLH